MKKFSLLFFLVAFLPALQAQEGQFIRPGLLRTDGTLSVGVANVQGVTNVYFHGTLEYYITNRVSIRGDGFYFIASMKDQLVFDANHSLLSGASHHIRTGNNFDPYYGVLFGLAMTKLPGDIVAEPVSYNPLLSPHIGFNYYGEKIFHIFGEMRYVAGKNVPAGKPASSLGELRFSFGLGLNLFTKKESEKKQGMD